MTLELFNADCLEKMKDISDNSIDLIICDLPYGCLTQQKTSPEMEKKYGKGRRNTFEGCLWDIKLNLEEFWKEIKRIRKDDHTPCLHFCSTKFGYDLIKSNEKEFRYDIVWCKSNAVGFLSANKKPMSGHEMIYVFSKKGANYNRIDIEGDFKGLKVTNGEISGNVYSCKSIFRKTPIKRVGVQEGKRCVKSWFEIANKSKKDQHPTAKPLELYKWLITRYSNEGDTVLDPTFGSGNSGLVSRELNRNYIGIEKDKGFYDKAVEKLITPLENE